MLEVPFAASSTHMIDTCLPNDRGACRQYRLISAGPVNTFVPRSVVMMSCLEGPETSCVPSTVLFTATIACCAHLGQTDLTNDLPHIAHDNPLPLFQSTLNAVCFSSSCPHQYCKTGFKIPSACMTRSTCAQEEGCRVRSATRLVAVLCSTLYIQKADALPLRAGACS